MFIAAIANRRKAAVNGLNTSRKNSFPGHFAPALRASVLSGLAEEYPACALHPTFFARRRYGRKPDANQAPTFVNALEVLSRQNHTVPLSGHFERSMHSCKRGAPPLVKGPRSRIFNFWNQAAPDHRPSNLFFSPRLVSPFNERPRLSRLRSKSRTAPRKQDGIVRDTRQDGKNLWHEQISFSAMLFPYDFKRGRNAPRP